MNDSSTLPRWPVAFVSLGLVATACDRTSTADRARETSLTAVNQRSDAEQAREADRMVAANTRRQEAQATEAERAVERRFAEQPRAAPHEAERARPEADAVVMIEHTEALHDIAQTRCEREQRCGQVGRGRRHNTAQACRARVVSDTSSDVDALVCQSGVGRRELDECRREIRDQDCSVPLDSIARVTACRTTDLCRRVSIVSSR